MNKILSVFKPISILIFVSISCSKEREAYISLITVPNDNIRVQAFIGESSRAVPYSPKGNFIRLIEPNSGIWNTLIIEKSNQHIESKIFYSDDNFFYKIYDSLKLGRYDLKFVSDLNDTITKTINFEHNIELKFPSDLNDFYAKNPIKNFTIKQLKEKDTLQLLFRALGCFGSTITHVEFVKDSNGRISFRKKIKGERFENEPENQWVYSKKTDITNQLEGFIANIQGIDIKDQSYCSTKVDYIFRMNNSKNIYWSKDKSCKYKRSLYRLLSIE